MTKINLNKVSVEFPIYNLNSRSVKKHFIRLATGGTVVKDANQRVIVNALKNITLDLKEGDRVGLIGHNGAGKSTFLRLLAKIYEPTAGHLNIEGRITPLLDMMSGIEEELTGYENITTRGTLLGLSRKEIKDNVEEISRFSGLGDYLSMPIRTYSSGMRVRLAFAISTAINPEILLIDEVFGAGDADFMLKAREKMISLLDQSSIVVLASHSDDLIKEFCNKVLLLHNGQIQFFGDVKEGMRLYQAGKQ